MSGVAIDIPTNDALGVLVDSLDRDSLFEFVVALGRRVGDHEFTTMLRDHFIAEVEATRDIKVGDSVVVDEDHFFRSKRGVVKGFRYGRAVVELAYREDDPFDAIIPLDKLSRVR